MSGKKDKYLVAAQKFIERGQLDKALGEFARVVEEDPKDTRTWLKMAELHAKRGANPEATEIYLRTGDLYTEQGFAQKAVAVYKNVLKLSPGTVAAHQKLGTLFKQLGLLQDAVQQFELASGALQRAQKLVDAVAALRQAMEIQPDNVVLRVKLAEAASQAGLTDEAVREFGKAAEQLKAQGRIDESLRVIERLLFHQPDNLDKARELAQAYIAKGSARLALPKLQACLNGDPRDPRTLSLLAQALEQLGQVPKAVSVLKELVRLCEELGRPAERDAALLRGLSLDPTDGELRAAASRYQARQSAPVTGAGPWPSRGSDLTPPPRSADTGAGSFDLSGVVRPSTGGGGSGRVLDPVGLADGSGPGVGISLSASPEVERILAEADVFVKYDLLERAADHLGRVFDLDAENRPAREKLITVLERLGRADEAARHRQILARQASRPVSRPTSLSLDENDPTADAPTPPPLTTMRTRHADDQDAAETPLPDIALATDFDVEVHTGDVLLEESEFEVSSGAIAHATLAVPPNPVGQLEGRDEAPWRNLDVDAAVDEVTPPPVVPARSPTPAPGSRRALSLDRPDDDGAVMFQNEAATIGASASILGSFVPSPTPPPVEGELDEDLEQVSFLMEQSLLDEAAALLQDLQTRFPGNPRVKSKQQQLEAVSARLEAVTTRSSAQSPSADRRGPVATIVRGPTADGATPPPRAVVNGGSADFATHVDLAIAYKEMGLYDAAVNELKQVARDPEREVFALTTMGECYEAKGSFTDAVIRYKRALNCEQITPQESLAIYYLLGGAFERLGDVNEALYFFEKVAKRAPQFRDVEQRISALRPRLVKRAR